MILNIHSCSTRSRFFKHTKGPFDATILINCLLGLLVVPKETSFDAIPDDPLTNLANWGISPESIKSTGKPTKANRQPDTWRGLVHNLRNSVAHFNQAAAGLKFFYTKTLGWDVLHLDLPPRTGRLQLPQVLSLEELQRLFTSTKNPRHRVLLMTTYAAGLRVSEVVRLKLTDSESDRMLLRVEQGKGRKDRYTLLSTRLLAELRAYWRLYRPAPWLFTGLDPHRPMPIGTAQKIYYHAKRTARITHGHGIHTLRHCFATHLLEAGVDVRTSQMLLGHQALDTTTRYLRITRQHLATIRSPFDLLPCGDTALPLPE